MVRANTSFILLELTVGNVAAVAVIVKAEPATEPRAPVPAEYTLIKYAVPELTDVLILVVPQVTGFNVPQAPENNCSLVPEVFRSLPIAESETVRLVPVGVILYHTSSSGFPVAHEGEGTLLADANHKLPVLFATTLERVMAPAQSSFAGGPETVAVMLNAEPVDVPAVAPAPAE